MSYNYPLFAFQDGNVQEANCVVKVDEYGFFIYWTSEGRVRLTYPKFTDFQFNLRSCTCSCNLDLTPYST